MNLRQVFIKFVLPISWSISKKRKVEALQEFALTEFDSGWQSLYALDFIDSSETRADLFQHAMEEFFHRDIFLNLCKHYSDGHLNFPAEGRNIILDENKADDRVLDFMCYMYVGEKSVQDDFHYYTKAKLDSKIRSTFLKIQKDEDPHVADSLRALEKFAASKWTLRKYIWLNKWKRAYRQFSVFSSRFGELFLSINLSIVYFVTGIIVYPILSSRMKLSHSDQFSLISKQVKEFNKRWA